jgi:hypothetical protein
MTFQQSSVIIVVIIFYAAVPSMISYNKNLRRREQRQFFSGRMRKMKRQRARESDRVII